MNDANPTFRATKHIFCIVYNQSYAVTRTLHGYEDFEDINEVIDDNKNVNKGW